MLFAALRSAVYVPAFVFFFGWLALRVRPYDERLGVILPAWIAGPGIVLMAVGAVTVLACVFEFVRRGRGTPAVFDPPRRFVASGPYKYVRNPMYLGGLGLLIGFSLVHQSVSMLLLAAALAVFFHLFVVFGEEPSLQRRFGASYGAYQRSVNRWIPRWR